MRKFWVYYLAFVFMLTGVGYFAIANVSDVPLALSDSEMVLLRGTAANHKCVDDATFGCADSPCVPNTDGIASYGEWYNDCVAYNNSNCSFRGQPTQTICRRSQYSLDCETFERVLAPIKGQNCK
jgi:hypothetical protein